MHRKLIYKCGSKLIKFKNTQIQPARINSLLQLQLITMSALCYYIRILCSTLTINRSDLHIPTNSIGIDL